MNGRVFTLIATMVVPAALIGVTVAFFSSNPVSIFGLLAVMSVGAVYLLTYREVSG
jgi:hypothetical protein